MLRIARVEIEHFRSIEHVAFSPASLCAIVGANNAGKSNILGALELLLGRSYPIEARLNENHFWYRDRRRPIRIKIVFNETSDDGSATETILAFGRDDSDGQYHVYCDNRWARGPERDRFPLIRVGVDRETKRNQPTNRWTLLGRMLLDINKQFIADPERVRDFEETMERLSDEVLTSVPAFRTLLDTLREEGARQLGRRVDDIGAELSLHDPWDFYRTLRVVVTECGIRMPADEMGMGVQSSIVIALLRAYAAIARESRAIIAIEEPELFLHPLAKRRFYRLLRELTQPDGDAPGIQVLYTTHSSAMVDLAHFDEVCVVRREPSSDGDRWTTTVRQLPMDVVVDRLRADGLSDATSESVRARLRRHGVYGRDVALFADVAVVVEGETEVLALPIWAEACGYDLDDLNIAVIQAGAKTAILELRAILEDMGIPCYVVADGDSHDGSTQHAAANRRLLESVGLAPDDFPATTVAERIAIWSEDYERELDRSLAGGYATAQDNARRELGGRVGKGVLARACAEDLVAAGTIPPPIRLMMERIVALRAASGDFSAAGPMDSADDLPF